MKIKESPFTSGASGRAFGVVGTTMEDGTPVLRGMPKIGNQGKDDNHKPAQNRARSIGRICRKFKAIARTTFTNRQINRSNINMFQKANMSKASGIVADDGTVDYSKLVVASGSTNTAALLVENAQQTAVDSPDITVDLTWNANANGANIKLKAVLLSQVNDECTIIDLGKNQSEAGGQFALDGTGYPATSFYAFWYDEVERQASSSVFIFAMP